MWSFDGRATKDVLATEVNSLRHHAGPRRRRHRVVLLLTPLMFCAEGTACRTSGDLDSSLVRTDTLPSAGLVVENLTPGAPYPLAGWGLDHVTVLSGDAFVGDPVGVALDEWDRLFVLERGPAAVRVFAPNGELIRSIGRDGAGPMEFRDGMMDVGYGNVVVYDGNQGRILRFDTTGVPLRHWNVTCCGRGLGSSRPLVSLGVTRTRSTEPEQLPGTVSPHQARPGRLEQSPAGGLPCPLQATSWASMSLKPPSTSPSAHRGNVAGRQCTGRGAGGHGPTDRAPADPDRARGDGGLRAPGRRRPGRRRPPGGRGESSAGPGLRAGRGTAGQDRPDRRGAAGALRRTGAAGPPPCHRVWARTGWLNPMTPAKAARDVHAFSMNAS
jgi:hypothetical protein